MTIQTARLCSAAGPRAQKGTRWGTQWCCFSTLLPAAARSNALPNARPPTQGRQRLRKPHLPQQSKDLRLRPSDFAEGSVLSSQSLQESVSILNATTAANERLWIDPDASPPKLPSYDRRRRRRGWHPRRLINDLETLHPADLGRRVIPGTFGLSGTKLVRLAQYLRPRVFPKLVRGGVGSVEEMMRERQLHVFLAEREQLATARPIYINEISLNTDKQILGCGSIEELLSLFVSQRGVFYVNNLITTIQMISVLACHLNDTRASESFDGSKLALHELPHDERFELLLSDIREQRASLDPVSAINTLIALRRLQIRNYLVFNALLETVASFSCHSKLPQGTVTLDGLIAAASTYRWCGYDYGTVFVNLANITVECQTQLSIKQLLQICKILAATKIQTADFFQHVQSWVTDDNPTALQLFIRSKAIPQEPYSTIPKTTGWTPLQAAQLFEALISVLQTGCPEGMFLPLLSRGAELVEKQPDSFSPRELVTMLEAFHRGRASFPLAIKQAAGLIGASLELVNCVGLRLAIRQGNRQTKSLSESRVGFFLDAASQDLRVTQGCNVTRSAVRQGLQFLERRIDSVLENTAVRACWAVANFSLAAEFSYLLSFLYRKLGRTAAWEAHKIRVFHLWIAQQVQFPSLEHTPPEQVLYDTYRHWCVARAGFRTPFLDEVLEISSCLTQLGFPHVVERELDGPYCLDIAFDDSRKALLVRRDCFVNVPRPSGNAALEVLHLRVAGWDATVLSRNEWNSQTSLESKLELVRVVLEDMGLAPSRDV